MTMRTDTNSTGNTMLFTLLGGVVLGAVAVALTTPKTGQEVRNTLRNTVRRLRGKAQETSEDELDTGTINALFI
jgi:gas vesicle protein